MSNEKDNLARLLEVMEQLREPDTGCPWDIAQTFESIAPYTIEEAYEVADAIASGDREDIRLECGDLLFQVVFYAQMAKEEGSFTFDDVARGITEKLIRRHPHVFENQQSLNAGELNQQWDKIKQQEKVRESDSIFSSIPSGLPSLTLAYKLQKACAKVGFDWPDAEPVMDKVKEEIEEIDEAIQSKSAADVEEEIGDALFALVNLARHHKINPDHALRNASYKFRQRFEYVESNLTENNRALSSSSLEEMENAWQQAKNYFKQHKKTPS